MTSHEPTPIEPEATIPPELFFLTLGALLETNRAVLKTQPKLSFAVLEGGDHTLDAAAPGFYRRGWEEDADLLVICNRRSISDFARGEFDPDRPHPGHVFLWEGDTEVLASLADVLSGGRTWLQQQMAHHQNDGGNR